MILKKAETMSKQRKIHLFNCDHTYKLDAVQNWMRTAKSKRELELTTNQHYFSLSQMTELSSKTIPELDMDVAVFVVHAHESCLLINEENDGIGYAMFYRALLQKTGGNVIIVIGGDDSYKDEDEEDKEFISRWARRKIYLQFSEEFMDGRKSFIFSWDKKHREIHEKALLHFFDPSKKGEKFEYQPPKQQLPPKPITPPPVRRLEFEPEASSYSRPYSSLSAEGPYTGERVQSTKPDVPVESRAHRISDQGARPKEKRSSSTKTKGKKGEMFEYQPRKQKLPSKPTPPPVRPSEPEASSRPYSLLPSLTSFLNSAIEYISPLFFTMPYAEDKVDQGARPKEKRSSSTETTKDLKGLSVLGWNAKQESLSAVTQLIQKHRAILNLSTDPDVLNLAVDDMISYLENNPLKYCVLVVDAEKVKAACDQNRGENYLRLLQTAERNVAEKIIITVCCPSSLSKNDERIVHRTIEKAFNDNSKVYVTWFQNGELKLTADEFIILFTSAIKNTEPYSQHRSGAAQIPSFETDQSVYAQENAVSGASRDIGCNNAFLVSSHGSHPHGKTEVHPLEPPADSFHNKIFFPTGKTLMVDTRLRNGIISKRPGDVIYWMPRFHVPFEIVRDLLNKNSKTSNAELVILLNERGELTCRVNKNRGKEWIVLSLDETVVLQTRLKYGQISFDPKDVVIRYQNYGVPQEEANKLMLNYKVTPDADLFVVSDSIGNTRMIVQVGPIRQFFTFINKTVGINVI